MALAGCESCRGGCNSAVQLHESLCRAAMGQYRRASSWRRETNCRACWLSSRCNCVVDVLSHQIFEKRLSVWRSTNGIRRHVGSNGIQRLGRHVLWRYVTW